MAFSYQAVSGVVPNWRPRHGPMGHFSYRAGTVMQTADDLRPGCHPTRHYRPATSLGALQGRRPSAVERAPGGVSAISVVRHGRPVATSATIDESRHKAVSLAVEPAQSAPGGSLDCGGRSRLIHRGVRHPFRWPVHRVTS
jgi:hypothetical protein